MKKLHTCFFPVLLTITLVCSGAALAGDGYSVTYSQNIMRFVEIDIDKADDREIYTQVVDEICKPGSKCQVLFWTENAPINFPMSREQAKAKIAYWQYEKKSGSHRLYVDCDRFPDIEDAECF